MSNKPDKYEDSLLYRIRHTAAHVMAEAVLSKFPDAKIAIGPPIDDGFYYDFDLPRPLRSDELPEIEAEMAKIISGRHAMVRRVVSKREAREAFAGQPYKLELIDGLPDTEEISLYTVDRFTDLCRGPHVENTKELNFKALKLMSIAGAYWRGDEKRPMLQRIYGTAWESPDDLKNYLDRLADIEKRDHRRLGKELDLFHLDDENPGQIFWHPNGWTVWRQIEDYVRRRIQDSGYVEVKTPSVMPKSLWERSGHWAKYQENMFITESEKRLFAIKPMNCPGHIEIFKQGLKSYRDLPLRMAEFGSCCRNEASGALHGIMRVRGFVQDDAHIFCAEAQIGSEVAAFVKLLKEVYRDFGFGEDKIVVKFSTRPEKRVGDDATWDRAEKSLADACKKAGLDYEVAPGEGAFYGPKLEFTLVDALGRHWQCGTIQVDYQLPSKERLDAGYIGDDGARHHPVILHRAILGSLERFIGILIEHYAGAFPIWLSPIQAVVIPVAPTFNDVSNEIAAMFRVEGLRVVADINEERMNNKIRKHQAQKVPYQLIVGGQEVEAGTVSVRTRNGQQHNGMLRSDFLSLIREKVAEKEEM